MKFYLITAFAAATAICLATSCKKEKPAPSPIPVTASTRTLKFILYTDKDFSNDNHNISFALHISDGLTAPFDSTVFSTQVKNIPDKAHQLVFEKKVPDDGKILTAGFTYAIENVGFSWHLDTCAANDKLKVIEYPFE